MVNKPLKGWKRMMLGDVCEINPLGDPLREFDEISFVSMADVDELGRLQRQSIRQVKDGNVTGYTRFRRGDILCAKITPCFENGKGAGTDSLLTEQGIGSTEFHVVRPSAAIQPVLAHAIVHSQEFRKRGKFWMTGSAGQQRVPADYLSEYLIHLPTQEQQHRIVALLESANRSIALCGRLLLGKVHFLDGLRDHLLRKQRGSRRMKLGQVTLECVDRNGGELSRSDIMAVTKEVGLRPMRAETIATDISRYKRLSQDGFAYNPMRLNIGSIARSSFRSDVLVSPDYVVFKCDATRLLPAYLDHLRFSRYWSSFFERAGDGGVRVRIYYDDLAQFKLHLPTIEKQVQVVRMLDAARLEIELLKRKLEALEVQKHGLLQKLLTGQWRLTRDLPGMGTAHV